MKVSNRPLINFKKIKIDDIFLKETYSNFIFFTVLVFLLVNAILHYTSIVNLSLPWIVISVTVFLFITIILAAGPGEAFEKDYEGEYRHPRNIHDFKKGMIYYAIFLLLAGIIMVYDSIDITHKPKQAKIIKKISKITIVDNHLSDKDTFLIKYFGEDGKLYFTDDYKNKKDRQYTLDQIIGEDGKLKRDISIEYIRNNKPRIEITIQQLNMRNN